MIKSWMRRSLRRRPADSDRVGIAPLDADAREALEALVEVFVTPDLVAVTTASLLDAPLDLASLSIGGAKEQARRADALARLLVHHVTERPQASGAAELRAAREALAEETARLHGEADTGDESEPELAEALRAAALSAIDDRLREVALEELDADLHLAFQEDGTPALAWMAVPPEAAHIWLLSRLYPRIELSLFPDPLLRLERRASRWWFERWSHTAHTSEEWEFTWKVREQEYSLVERASVALDAPILTAFRAQSFFAEVPPRQQRLAQALDESFVDVFTVREHEAERLVLEGVSDGTRYEVHEHNPGLEYRPGFLALGRLLPFDGDRYLRSPGMAFMTAPSGPDSTTADLASNLAEGLEKAGSIGRGIAIETYLALLQHRTRVPRRVLAAESPREAQGLLQRFHEAMQEHGLVESVPDEEVLEELRQEAAQGEGVQVLKMPLDEPLVEWMQALTEQARALSRRGRTPKARKSKRSGKSKAKGKKKRRR